MPDEERRAILCVDDERDVLDALYDTLMDNYHVKTATSAREALEIFDQNDISLVISDQRMPEMEGTEFLAAINKKKSICKKILLTGYADINAAIDAINLGNVDRYFGKPWDDGELTTAVNELMATYKIDVFLDKMLQDGKRLKTESDQGKRTSELFEKFLNSWELGICLLGSEDAVTYMNRKGLEIIRHWELDDIRGKDFNSIFLMDEALKMSFHEKYLKKDFSPHVVDIKRGDGSNARAAVRLTFVPDEGAHVCGIIFEPA